jgi:hypothetical protein
VDEILELLFVLVCVPVGRVAEDAALLDEVLERGLRVALRAESKFPGGFGR